MKTGFPLFPCWILLFCLAATSQVFAASDRVVATQQGTVLQAGPTTPALPCGALTLSPSLLFNRQEPVAGSITAEGIREIISASRGEGCNEGASDISYGPAMRYSWAVSGAPGFDATLAFANPDDPLALAPLTPVAEASTWFAAALATLLMAWHARRILFRHRPAFITRSGLVLRRWALRFAISHGEPNSLVRRWRLQWKAACQT